MTSVISKNVKGKLPLPPKKGHRRTGSRPLNASTMANLFSKNTATHTATPKIKDIVRTDTVPRRKAKAPRVKKKMLDWSTGCNGAKFAARLFKNIRRWSVGDLGNAGKRFGKEHTLFGHPQATKARDFIKNNKFYIFAYSNEPFKSGLMELFQHCLAVDSERTIRDDTSEY